MRVVHFVCEAPPEIGGMGKAALREVSGLRARGIEAKLIAPEIQETTQEASFVKRLPFIWRIGNASTLNGWKEEAKKADVIHLHYPYYGTGEFMLLSSETLPPIVVTYHMDARASGYREILFRLERFFFQFAMLKRAKKILVSSFDYAKHSTVSKIFQRLPDRFVELPFGIDTHAFSPGPATRARFSVPNGVPCVLFVGGLDRAHAFKGIDILLHAVSMIPDAHVLLAGDGDLRPTYEEQARMLGIASRVHFLGKIDDVTLTDAYRTADVFAFPSTSSAEAFGLVALEAQACGTPVVASDLPGVRTVVKDGLTGFLVPVGDVERFADRIQQIATDTNLRARMSAEAVKHASGYSHDAHIDGLVRVYQDILR
ncbi:glycosyltransferase family 4 protein [Candidatus Uhrbacteria bacterium]|nr:glycosyltransferase family 4 protein [Candidatus Uhrbacteria bacterium]